MTSSGWAAVVVALIVVVGGVWWFTQHPAAPQTTVDITQQQATTTDTTGQTATTTGTDANMPDNGVSVGVGATVSTPKTVTVSYTDAGFSPKSVTINKGDTVTFVNNSTGRPMWVASDAHPTHTEYDGTSRTTHCAVGYAGAKPFDECGTGSSYSFTFTKAGSIEYHNHSSAQFTGMVVVQ